MEEEIERQRLGERGGRGGGEKDVAGERDIWKRRDRQKM